MKRIEKRDRLTRFAPLIRHRSRVERIRTGAGAERGPHQPGCRGARNMLSDNRLVRSERPADDPTDQVKQGCEVPVREGHPAGIKDVAGPRVLLPKGSLPHRFGGNADVVHDHDLVEIDAVHFADPNRWRG